MKIYKFRGKDKDGNLHYGGIFKFDFDDGTSQCNIIEKYFETEEEKAAGIYCIVQTPILPETVAQFVGYDKNGKEIYSDDEIRIYTFNSYGIAIDSWIEKAEFNFDISDIGKKFDDVELVEDTGNV